MRQQRNALGNALRRVRRERGISQEDFAEMAGVHRNYVGRVERGEIDPSLSSLRGLARAAKMPLSRLIELSEG